MGDPLSKSVYGKHTKSGYAVYGEATASGGYGVTGVAVDAYGVLGQSTSGVGVRGQILANSAANTSAIYGVNLSTYSGGTPGFGGNGVYGYSKLGNGVFGETGVTGGAGVWGIAKGGVGAYAGYFDGDVVTTGAKSAAVANGDGTHSLLYCVESPESWFEDFGKGTLANGKAEVKIDPQFGKVADMADYHVFLTAYGNTNGLHVTGRSAQGFTVEEHNGGKNSLAFSYRIVGKRKDVAGTRLARVHLPPRPKRKEEESGDKQSG